MCETVEKWRGGWDLLSITQNARGGKMEIVFRVSSSSSLRFDYVDIILVCLYVRYLHVCVQYLEQAT